MNGFGTREATDLNILVLSDSHGRSERVEQVLARQIRTPDAVVFLGDGLRDVINLDTHGAPLLSVSGNCDAFGFFGDFGAEKEIVMTLGGKRFLMTHGHEYGVKSGLGRIVAAAVEKDVDVVLFGHTHMAFEKRLPDGESEYGIPLKKPLYLFNPGSIGDHDASFGCVLVRENGEIMLSHGSL